MLREALNETGPIAAVVCTDDADWVRAQPVFDGMLIRSGFDPADEVRCPFSAFVVFIIAISHYPIHYPAPGHGDSCLVQAHDHVPRDFRVVGCVYAPDRR